MKGLETKSCEEHRGELWVFGLVKLSRDLIALNSFLKGVCSEWGALVSSAVAAVTGPKEMALR